jgi:hypothetical protein
MLAACACLAVPAHADGPYRNPDNKNPNDPAEGTYPVPYKKPVAAEIAAALRRIRDYLDRETQTRVVHKAGGAPVTDFREPVADAVVATGDAGFGLQAYEMGVVHAGLIEAAAVTGDQRYTALTERHLRFFADTLPYFRAQEQRFHLERANSFAHFLDPRALDDAGSMCAALMRATRASVRTCRRRSACAATGSPNASSACPTAPLPAGVRKRCRCGPTICTWGSPRWRSWAA